ncbi:hypothetical protein PR048_000825 [Dryococelus australis]|uniref:Uncharacterized protein n=1 Tax=Dryococelus australis TaxID=614101 RepID=A0ABQ9IGA7_9NEOP|nr:hypothetical protein PR048_000825 [Dryococelus australis]
MLPWMAYSGAQPPEPLTSTTSITTSRLGTAASQRQLGKQKIERRKGKVIKRAAPNSSAGCDGVKESGETGVNCGPTHVPVFITKLHVEYLSFETVIFKIDALKRNFFSIDSPFKLSGSNLGRRRPRQPETQPIRVIDVNIEQRRNEGAGETGDPRENPPTNGIVRHDAHLRKNPVTRPGTESGALQFAKFKEVLSGAYEHGLKSAGECEVSGRTQEGEGGWVREHPEKNRRPTTVPVTFPTCETLNDLAGNLTRLDLTSSPSVIPPRGGPVCEMHTSVSTRGTEGGREREVSSTDSFCLQLGTCPARYTCVVTCNTTFRPDDYGDATWHGFHKAAEMVGSHTDPWPLPPTMHGYLSE